SRLFQTETLDFQGRAPDLQLASLYVDQFPNNDLSRAFAAQYGFRLCPAIAEALTLGGDRLAGGGGPSVGGQGAYADNGQDDDPHNDKGQGLYPRKRFCDATVEVFRRSGRVVPVFVDKHLSHSWEEAKEMVETARRLRFPLMAGSSLPGTWRRPALAVPG